MKTRILSICALVLAWSCPAMAQVRPGLFTTIQTTSTTQGSVLVGCAAGVTTGCTGAVVSGSNVFTSNVPGVTTNTLYNNAGTLKFGTSTIPFGTGTTGTLVKWTASGTLGDSIAGESGAVLTVTSVVNATTGFRVSGGAGSGRLLQGNGTNYSASGFIFPTSTGINRMLFSSATNVIDEIVAGTNGVLVTNNSSVPGWLGGPAADRRILMSASASAPTWSLAAYPSSAGSSGQIIVSNGTDFAVSVAAFPTASAAVGKFIQSDATNWIATAFTVPSTSGTAGQVWRSDGSNTAFSTMTYPNTITANFVPYATGSNALGATAGLQYNAVTLAVSHSALATDLATFTHTSTGDAAILLSRSGGTVSNWKLDLPSGQTYLGFYNATNGVVGSLSLTGVMNATTGYQVNSAATASTFLRGDGTQYIPSTITVPSTAGTSGQLWASNGTNTAFTTATYPLTVSANAILCGTSSNVFGACSGLTYNGTLLSVASGGAAPQFWIQGPSGQEAQFRMSRNGDAIGSYALSFSTGASVIAITANTGFGIDINANGGGGGALPWHFAAANGGLYSDTATSSSMGAGTINVKTGVYLNGAAYTNPDFVFEKAYTGQIVKFAVNVDRMGIDYRGLQPLADVEAFTRTRYELPMMAQRPDRDVFLGGELLMGAVEEAYLYLFELNHKIAALEADLRRLKGAQ